MLDDDGPIERVDLCGNAQLLPAVLVAIFLPRGAGGPRQQRMALEIFGLRDERLLVGISVRDQRAVGSDDEGKAMVAAGNSLLTSVYHLLSDPAATYQDLGPHHHDTLINRDRRARHLAAALEAVTGQTILIRDGRAQIIDSPQAA